MKFTTLMSAVLMNGELFVDARYLLLNLQGEDLRKNMPRASNPQHLDEAKNALGSNRCSGDNECDGFRTCSAYGFCQGWAGIDGIDYNVAAPTPTPTPPAPTPPAPKPAPAPSHKKTADEIIHDILRKYKLALEHEEAVTSPIEHPTTGPIDATTGMHIGKLTTEGVLNAQNNIDSGNTYIRKLSGTRGSVQNFGLLII